MSHVLSCEQERLSYGAKGAEETDRIVAAMRERAIAPFGSVEVPNSDLPALPTPRRGAWILLIPGAPVDSLATHLGDQSAGAA